MVTRAELLELLDRLDEEDAEKVLAYLRTLERPRTVADEDLTDTLDDGKDVEDLLDDAREADRYGG